jgi:predicted kinase
MRMNGRIGGHFRPGTGLDALAEALGAAVGALTLRVDATLDRMEGRR